ncbi:Mediator of RNA polymerase II transcription subunit 15a [Cardamine amara subsp. amara]|uniref:Mediator of RNA polymerase II transcription subunit 15a n=1 Tax=Cardamine amara subsp. amara TaxID=228776 RepID=A0ABD1BMN4_CARAN
MENANEDDWIEEDFQKMRSMKEIYLADNNANRDDWEPEVFEKLKSMKETYSRDLNDIHQRVSAELQHVSLPQQQRSDQVEKLKQFKTVSERWIRFLNVSRSNITLGLSSMKYNEMEIRRFINELRPRMTLELGQLLQSLMQQPQSQSVQSDDNQTNPQMQSMSMQIPQYLAIGTPGTSASPLLQEVTSPDGNNLNPLTSTSGKPSATELPIERLIRAVKSISPQALSSAVSDIGSVVSMVDRIAGSAPRNGSKASVGEDLVAMTKCRLQAGNGSETSDLESTETSDGKKARTETEHALLEEIKEINQRLIDTVVEFSDDEDASDPSEGATSSKWCEGTTVRFSFIAVSLSPALKAHLSSTQTFPIQPLRLLVPCSYPNGSPTLLDKVPVETSKENEDLSSKAMARFNILLNSLSQPRSLKDIAKTWDACVRAVICEYAQQLGGGTFSSKYGTWEKFVAAS